MQTELYIEDQLVDLSSSVSFPVTKQFQDLQDPTAILNEWSKTVKIPFTNNNDRLFGLIFNPSRAVITDGEEHSNSGIWFDPTKKMEARLMFSGNLLLQGYAKMTSIKRTQTGGYYEINLFGELGSFFSDVKGLSWGDMVDGYAFNEFTIDRDIVNTSWTTEPDTSTALASLTETTDVIGFACTNQGVPENFDGKSLQDGDGIVELKTRLEDALGTTTYNIEGLVGDGLTPRQMCDYRSYHQQPYIYLPRFFQIVQAAINSQTDYTLTLNSDWFHSSNPYYQDMVMLMSRLQNNGETTSTTTESFTPGSTTVVTEGEETHGSGTLDTFTYDVAEDGTTTLQVIYPVTLKAKLETRAVSMGFQAYGIYEGNALGITLNLTGSSGTTYSKTKWICTSDPGVSSGDLVIIPEDYTLDSSNGGFKTYLGWEYTGNYDGLGASVTATITYEWFDTSEYAIVGRRPGEDDSFYNGNPYVYFQTYIAGAAANGTRYIVNSKGDWHSGYTATLADLWNTDDTPWDIVVKYCKKFGLLIQYDIATMTCEIMTRATFFDAGEEQNWDKRVCYDKEFAIAPSSFDSLYLGFDPSDDTDKGEAYKEQIGVGFGGKKLNTGYEFNTETKNILEGKAPIFSSENILPWSRMLAGNFTYRNTEPMVYAANEGAPADMFGTLYFYNGLCDFDSTTGLPYITDDTPGQVATGTYTYIDGSVYPSYATQVETYPQLDVRYMTRYYSIDMNGNIKVRKMWSTKLCTYSIPALNYDSTKSFTSSDTGIYDTFWADYIAERYGINTKVVTCYLWITPAVFANLTLNTRIRIGERLYMLNKICDYDCTKMQPTKCELVSIYNTEIYTSNPVAILYEWDEGTVISYVSNDEWEDTTAVLTKGAWDDNIAILPNTE